MRTPQKITLVASLFGILVLLFLSQTLEPKITAIVNITKQNINQQVKILGKIISIREYNNQTFQVLELQDETGIIEATANSKAGLKGKLNLSQNQDYLITGKIAEYNNTLQLNINKIILKEKK